MGLKQAVNMTRIMQWFELAYAYSRRQHISPTAAKLKTAALEHLRLDLRNRFEGLQLDEDASPEVKW